MNDSQNAINEAQNIVDKEFEAIVKKTVANYLSFRVKQLLEGQKINRLK